MAEPTDPTLAPSRRRLLGSAALGAVGVAVGAAGGLAGPARSASAQAVQPLPEAARAIMTDPRYAIARWHLYAADRATGETLFNFNGDELILPASTTKLWSTGAALAAYGADFRFETPVYRRGTVDAAGTLAGDLVLVASGDMTMGGRDTADGRIDFTDTDHSYANTLPGATLTPEDPLAGLADLARQVAAAGIRRVQGDVLIDARLFEQMPKDEYLLSPIMINDNLIDLTIRPGAPGDQATLEWRPQTAAYEVRSSVRTVAAGQPLDVDVTTPQPGVIAVEGTIPADQGEILRTAQVADPPSFARTLFVEALRRNGVAVDAAPTGPNPAAKLPPVGSYDEASRVGLLRSLPFSENIRVVNKVSMNLHADMLIMLLAVRAGERTFDAGMQQVLPFVQSTGIDPATVSLSDGRGNEYTDLFSPRTVTDLLRYMATRPDFGAYFDSLPVFGEPGSESFVVPPTSPVVGKVAAKSGSTAAADLMHQRPIVMTRGNAGYLTGRSGRELAFAVYVMHVPIESVEGLIAIAQDVGRVVEAIYDTV